MASDSIEKISADLERLAEESDSSPLARLLELKIVKADRGYALTNLKISEEKHLNFRGATHGAVIFALADHACAICGNSLGRKAVLLHSSINFFANPAPGSVIEAEAEMTHEGQETGSMNIEVKSADGRLLAKGQFIVYFFRENDQRDARRKDR